MIAKVDFKNEFDEFIDLLPRYQIVNSNNVPWFIMVKGITKKRFIINVPINTKSKGFGYFHKIVYITLF